MVSHSSTVGTMLGSKNTKKRHVKKDKEKGGGEIISFSFKKHIG